MLTCTPHSTHTHSQTSRGVEPATSHPTLMSFKRLKELFYVYIIFDFVHKFNQLDVFIFFKDVQVKQRLIKFICMLDLNDLFFVKK